MADQDIITKRCSKCSTVKQKENFTLSNSEKDGLKRWCIACVKQYNKINKEKNNARNKLNRESNPIIYAEKQKLYRIKHLEKRKDYEKVKYQNNKDDYKNKATIWAKQNPKKRAEIRKKWRDNNLELAKCIEKKCLINNPAIARARTNNRRARVKGAIGSFNTYQIKDLLLKQKSKCACCKEKLNKTYHADHIEPLARGGSNDIRNIQLLCPQCNWQKGAKDPIEFMQSKGLLF